MPIANPNLPRRVFGPAAALLLTLLAGCDQSSRPDLEQTGYVSMVFEIDTGGQPSETGLAQRMIEILEKRVDPKGRCGLQWRVVAPNRIEVRVPLPPADVRELRRTYEKARDALTAENLDLDELQTALRLAQGRDARLAELAAGSAERAQLLDDVARAFDAHERAQAALAATTMPADEQPASPPARPDVKELKLVLRDAEEALNDLLDALRDANFDLERFERVFEMDATSALRRSSIAHWQQRFPTLRLNIADAAASYDAWRLRSKSPCDPAALKRLLRGAGVLEFRLLAEPSPENPFKYDHYRERLHERGPQPAPGDSLQWFAIDNPLSFLNLQSAAELRDFDPRTAMFFVVEECADVWYVLAKRGAEDGLLRPGGGRPEWRVERAYVTRDAIGGGAAAFELDEKGGALFAELTGNNIRKQLCVLIDDVAYSSARIESRIDRSAIISGDFSPDKVEYLVRTLQAGVLPARFKSPPISERVVEPKP